MAPPDDSDDDDARFRPPPVAGAKLDIELDSPHAANAPAIASDPSDTAPQELCPEHELQLPCQLCAEAKAAERDRSPVGPLAARYPILRQRHQVRIAGGIALGLLLGFLLTAPYASRQERRVTVIKREADLERYRYDPEAQARVRALDERADNLANRSALVTITAWLVIGGLGFWVWYKVT